MIKTIKAIYRFVIPRPIRRIRREIVDSYLIKNQPKRNQKALEIVRIKSKIKVAFFLIHDSIWKYDGVYKLMEEDDRFEPIVIVCPYIVYGEKTMLLEMNQAYENFKIKGYNVIKTLNEETSEWLDVKKEIRPDIVFFTNPHNITKKEYYINNFLHVLTCYVPYAFVVIHSIEMHYNQNFHYFLWKHFVETKYHKEFANIYLLEHSKNVIISGYPSLDKVFRKDYKPKNVWKDYKKGNAKKIIWAPHHTISGQGEGLDYSSFMEYHEYFIVLLKRRDDIQIAFKPHPMLKVKLYKNKEWGNEKTDSYYNIWNKLPNGQLEEGEYTDLFQLSDAMIMDSASFIVEYLYFDKPLCFTMRNDAVKDRFNSFGKIVFNYLYTAKDNNEIDFFIDNVVIGEKDILKSKRNHFLINDILPKNGKTASENIYNELKRELC
jgi:hypothetical protein